MNITFLIGNGFDIGLGLDSKFSDFIPLYKLFYINENNEPNLLASSFQNNKDAWSDFEKQLGIFTNEFTTKTKNDYKKLVVDFELKFMDYLVKIESNLDYSNQEKICEIMKNGLLNFYSSDYLPVASSSLVKHTYDIFSNSQHTYNFINFNYTDCLEKCLKTIPKSVVITREFQGQKVDRIGKIVHIHGKTGNYPIMGVNDESQISNQELAKDKRFLKSIVKPYINESIRMNRDINASRLISESTIICIYGMSLGATDKKWWNKIIKWLSTDGNRQLVIFLYDPNYRSSSQMDWIDKEDEIIDKLDEYCKNLNYSAENCRNRIHLSIHNNIFEMKLNKQKEIFDLALNKLANTR